jgi:CzcA family heavy metal efflux pump
MRFFKMVVNNRVVVYIMTFIIIIIGAFAYASLPRESSPSITIPYVFVTTVYVGVSPQDIESLVTQEIEKEIKGIKDVKKITSVSRESFSTISIEFTPDVKIDDALQKVRDKVSVAKTKMPKDIKEPIINEVNFSEFPILYVNISGNEGLAKLKDLGDKLSDKIEGISGVLSAEVVGGLEREVKINVDADRLKYYNLSFNDITNTISAENISIPGGGVDVGSSNYLVRVPGEIEDPSIISDFVIKTDNKSAAPVYIRDVAQVIYGYKEKTTFSRENGKESITILVKKRSGENIVRIADETKDLVKAEQKNFPAGVKVSFTGDQSKNVKDTVHELENGIITGMVLVIAILLLFLGLKNALLTATSIPLSFLISFMVLSWMGITLNIVVLFTLILVLGIIVDDAIVVMENIYRLQEKEGYNPYDSSLEGPREVVKPVSIATLTIISSFLPLLFFPGIVGEFMKFLPMTLIVCLSSSLFVAMVISPVQASVFINVQKDKKKKAGPLQRAVEHFDEKFFGLMVRQYERALKYSLRRRKLVIGGTVLLLIVMFFLYGKFNNGVEFFPSVEPRQANINITMPIGTNVDKTNDFTQQIEKKLPVFKDVEYYIANVGSSNNPLDFSGDGIPNKSTITLNFHDKADREKSSFATIEDVRAAVTVFAGGNIYVEKQTMGPPTGPPINIEITGDDFEKLGEISEDIQKQIKETPGIKDLKDDFDQARPEIKVNVDREKAALYKLNTATIASTIRTAINGTAASTYRVGEDEYDITVRLEKNQRDNISAIENLYISNRDNAKVPLTSVASVQFSGGIGAINRKDLNRVVTVSANAEGRLGNDVLKDVMAKLKDYKMPDGYTLKYTGEQEDQKETSDFLGKAFMISLLLIFMLMVIEFNSLTTPLIIMFSVLLSLIGVFAGLLITQTPFGIVMTGIGVIALAGIVVRNAIVLLDFQKELEKQGLSRDEAMIKSGVIRLRPVFLTAAATIIGLVPLTTGIDFDWRSFSWVIGGENTAFWRPMGVAIIFGLSVATFLTLVVVPSIYTAVDDVKIRFKNRKKKKKIKPDEAPAKA